MRPMRAPGNPQLPSRRGAPSAHGQARGARKWVRRVGGLGFRSHDRSLWGSQGRSCKYRSASLGGCRRSRSFKLACVLLAAGHGCHPAPRAAPSIPYSSHKSARHEQGRLCSQFDKTRSEGSSRLQNPPDTDRVPLVMRRSGVRFSSQAPAQKGSHRIGTPYPSHIRYSFLHA
jgi:hypothetical protein